MRRHTRRPSGRLDQTELLRPRLTLSHSLTPTLMSCLVAHTTFDLPHHLSDVLVLAYHPLGGLHRVPAPIGDPLDKIRRQIDLHRIDLDVDIRRVDLWRLYVDGAIVG
jgi:hypothetical protein